MNQEMMMASMDKGAAPIKWLLRHKEAIARIGAGHLCYSIFNWLYDHVLYVFIVYRLGMFFGGALMTAGSLVQCAALLLAYQRMGVDWVGAAAIHSFASRKGRSFTQGILTFTTQRGKIPIFLTLCIFQDPFITTAYFKRGTFERLSRKD